MSRMVVATVTLVLAVGCASGEQPTTSDPAKHHAEQPAQSTSPPADQPAQTRDETISVRISEGRVDGVPARVEVDSGTRIRLEVSSDRSDELHIHGYDKTAPLPAGTPAVVTFVADVAGVFEVETHDSGLLLFQLVVRG